MCTKATAVLVQRALTAAHQATGPEECDEVWTLLAQAAADGPEALVLSAGICSTAPKRWNAARAAISCAWPASRTPPSSGTPRPSWSLSPCQNGTPVCSQYVEQLYARELMSDRAGAVGYPLKDRVSDVGRFIDTVRRVAAGATVMDPDVVASLLARHEDDKPLRALTPREREVLSLMAEGRSNAAIAARMFVTERAVSKHSNNIFGKLGLQQSEEDNRRVLAVLAYLQA
jgi:DNA-binding CsgD family transcriptional regulator